MIFEVTEPQTMRRITWHINDVCRYLYQLSVPLNMNLNECRRNEQKNGFQCHGLVFMLNQTIFKCITFNKKLLLLFVYSTLVLSDIELWTIRRLAKNPEPLQSVPIRCAKENKTKRLKFKIVG